MQLYTKSQCRFCELAKTYLSNKGVSYDIIDITNDDQKREYLMSLGVRSIPQLFINNELVPNGFDGILELSNEQLGIYND